jgi:hypothetical protein
MHCRLYFITSILLDVRLLLKQGERITSTLTMQGLLAAKAGRLMSV